MNRYTEKSGGLFQAVPRRRGDEPPGKNARAEDMGFWTKMPVYHGTVSDLDAFTFGRGGTVSGSLVGTLGVSVALDREVAEEFAKKSAQGGSRTGPKASGRKAKSQTDGVVLELLHRAEKPALIDLTGREKDLVR